MSNDPSLPHRQPRPRARKIQRRKRSPKLLSPGWAPGVRSRLEQLIGSNAGKQLPVVFDFDNTIVCGDVGEATLALLARDGRITPEKLSPTLAPDFHSGAGKVSLRNSVDVTQYYDAFLAATAHANDPAPLGNGYAWAVEAMEGLALWEVTEAAREAYELGQLARPHWIEVTPGKSAFPAPFFYDEMVELIGCLIDYGFAVWIVSASNVWSVRWMVLRALNPRLQKLGQKQGLPPERVIGISTLLIDSDGRLFKDDLLLQEKKAYAKLDRRVLESFRLTSRLDFPVPTYSGKVARIFDRIGGRPWLCVGDSPGDHAMLLYSEHRLWLARLEKPDYQRPAVKLISRDRRNWMVQPLLACRNPGFVSELEAVSKLLNDVPEEVSRSMAILGFVP